MTNLESDNHNQYKVIVTFLAKQYDCIYLGDQDQACQGIIWGMVGSKGFIKGIDIDDGEKKVKF